MSRRVAVHLATLALLGTIFCFRLTYEPGGQTWAALGTGLLAAMTVQLILVAARKDGAR
jgi:hypothetical protein